VDTFEGFMKRIIKAIEGMPVFSVEGLASALGIGEEEANVYLRQYVLERGLVPRPSINFNRLGFAEIRVFMSFSCEYWKAVPSILDSLCESGFLVSYYRVMHACNYVTRHAVPLPFMRSYTRFIEDMLSFGWLRSYEVKSINKTYRFSPDPSVFDYNRGEWSLGQNRIPSARQMVDYPVDPVPYDELDLRIISALKRYPLMDEKALSSSLGVSAEEVHAHLEEHIEGRHLLKGYYLDFSEGFQGGDTAVLGSFFAIGEDDGEGLLARVLAYPYLAFLGVSGAWIEALQLVPVYRLFRALRAAEDTVRESGARDFMTYLSPLYDLNTLARRSSRSFLERNYIDGKWAFYGDLLLEEIRTRVKDSLAGGGGEGGRGLRGPKGSGTGGWIRAFGPSAWDEFRLLVWSGAKGRG